jgi:Uncharacterized protein conserved in bacteria (DUF2334)
MIIENWLPTNKKAAICFTIDDLHPAKISDHGYDAGGDLNNGVFGKVNWLLERHPKLKVTLFTTADWREISPFPTRKLLAKIPVIRDWFYLAKIKPKGTFQINKFHDFQNFYSNHKQVEIALHGLHHCHKGLKIPVEFQNQSLKKCNAIVKKMLHIFDDSKIPYTKGFTPPAWNASENLIEALINNKVNFLASARDILTPITKTAKNKMSGYPNISILYPEYINNKKMIHLPSNFQATSKFDRAFEIIENNGIVSIKAHIMKNAFGHIALDGVDQNYMEYLDKLLYEIETKFGDQIWWTTMGEISEKIINKQE